MSGLDFSAAALAHARSLAAATGADVDFHEADVYLRVESVRPGTFDFVYTGIGALSPGWSTTTACLECDSRSDGRGRPW